MSREILDSQRSTWEDKPVLRAIYADFYRRIVEQCVPGPTLEIGGGSGNLKQVISHVVSTDLVPTKWVDAAADAQQLPFGDDSFANVVGVDILHHIEQPRRFLAEAQRAILPGGHLILLEPAITPVSSPFYRFFHPEPVDMSENPLSDRPLDPKRRPFDANQAIPTLIFNKYRDDLATTFPSLELKRLDRFAFFVYPLSGGFRFWSLIPERLVSPLLKLEQKLAPALAPLMAFRLLAVIEKRRPTTGRELMTDSVARVQAFGTQSAFPKERVHRT